MLKKDAKYHELFVEINKDSDCPNCGVCKLREMGGQLFVVDTKGQGKEKIFIMIRKPCMNV